MNPKEFPQFYGKITYVAGIVERDGITHTIVDYVKPGQEPQWQEITELLYELEILNSPEPRYKGFKYQKFFVPEEYPEDGLADHLKKLGF